MAANNPFFGNPLDRVTNEIHKQIREMPDFSQVRTGRQAAGQGSLGAATIPSGQILPPEPLQPLFLQASQQYQVPANVLMAIGLQESSYRPDAVGVETKWGTAKGLMQYIDDTAAGMGIDPFDPAQSVDAAARQFQQRLANGYSVEEAIMAHHGGDNRRQWGPKTRQYLEDVLAKAGAIRGELEPMLAAMQPAPEPEADAAQGQPEAPQEQPVLQDQDAPGFSASGRLAELREQGRDPNDQQIDGFSGAAPKYNDPNAMGTGTPLDLIRQGLGAARDFLQTPASERSLLEAVVPEREEGEERRRQQGGVLGVDVTAEAHRIEENPRDFGRDFDKAGYIDAYTGAAPIIGEERTAGGWIDNMQRQFRGSLASAGGQTVEGVGLLIQESDNHRLNEAITGSASKLDGARRTLADALEANRGGDDMETLRRVEGHAKRLHQAEVEFHRALVAMAENDPNRVAEWVRAQGVDLQKLGETLQADPEYQGVTADIVGGVASMLMYLGPGFLTTLMTRGAPAGVQAVAGIAGASALAGPAGAAEAYQRAIDYGLSEEESLEIALKGIPAGIVQVAPVAVILKRIPVGVRGKAVAQFRHLLESFGAEFIAEGSGAVLQNLVEQSYNPDKGTWDDSLYQAAIGGSSSALIALGVQLATRGRGIGPISAADVGREMDATARRMQFVDTPEMEALRRMDPDGYLAAIQREIEAANPQAVLAGDVAEAQGPAPEGPIERAVVETQGEERVAQVPGERVTVQTRTGAIHGTVEDYFEGGDGSFQVQVLADDGESYVFDQDSQAVIIRDQVLNEALGDESSDQSAGADGPAGLPPMADVATGEAPGESDRPEDRGDAQGVADDAAAEPVDADYAQRVSERRQALEAAETEQDVQALIDAEFDDAAGRVSREREGFLDAARGRLDDLLQQSARERAEGLAAATSETPSDAPAAASGRRAEIEAEIDRLRAQDHGDNMRARVEGLGEIAALQAELAGLSESDAAPSQQAEAAQEPVAEQEAEAETTEDGEPIVRHTTKRGRELTGVLRDIPLSQAKEIDPAAFRKQGKSFIRLDRLPAEQRGEPIQAEGPQTGESRVVTQDTEATPTSSQVAETAETAETATPPRATPDDVAVTGGDLVMKSDGSPYRSYETARRAAKNRKITGTPVQVDGGWAIQRSEATTQDPAPATAAITRDNAEAQLAPARWRGDQAKTAQYVNALMERGLIEGTPQLSSARDAGDYQAMADEIDRQLAGEAVRPATVDTVESPGSAAKRQRARNDRTPPIADARREDKKRQLREQGREAAEAGEANEIPEWAAGETDLENAWTRGWNEGMARRAEQQAADRPAPSENTIFTEEAAEKARALLKSRLGQINTGLDPEMFQAGLTLAGYHVERGARSFAAYARAMVDDLGEAVKPHLKQFYMGLKYDPRATGFEGMDAAADVDAADVDAVLAETAEPTPEATDDTAKIAGIQDHVARQAEARRLPEGATIQGEGRTWIKRGDDSWMTQEGMDLASQQAYSGDNHLTDYGIASLFGEPGQSPDLEGAQVTPEVFAELMADAEAVDMTQPTDAVLRPEGKMPRWRTAKAAERYRDQRDLLGRYAVKAEGKGFILERLPRYTLELSTQSRQSKAFGPEPTTVYETVIRRPENMPHELFKRLATAKAGAKPSDFVQNGNILRVSDAPAQRLIDHLGAAVVDNRDDDARLTPIREGTYDDGTTDQGATAPDQAGGQAPAGGRGRDSQPGAAPADPGVVAGAASGDVATPAEGASGGTAGGGAAGEDVGADGSADRRGRADERGEESGGTGSPDARRGGRGLTEPRNADSISPANPGPGNFHYDNPLEIVGGGQVARFKKNQAAIEKYVELRDENRMPTREEQEVLAGYTGWGSFGQELFQGTWHRPQPKPGWEARDQWLRDHLGQSEWEGMQRSIINAHYTDPPTVMAMWGALRKMGFTGGRVLEPAMGVGNFFGMMPLELKNRSELTGIELDPVTGSIAQRLYPKANIRVMGYQESRTPDNFYDVVIGNWPFENSPIADRRYNKLNPMVHDYFFLKALDQVRPGGIVMAITSAGTMDKKNAKIRREMAQKAELVAAFRLPSGAFEQYAGTNVVTDIIILRKRAERALNVEGEGWVRSEEMATPAGETISVNEYYHRHPDHVIGTLDFGSGSTYGRPSMIVHRPSDMLDRLNGIVDLVPEDGYQASSRPDAINYVTNHTADREGALTRTSDGLYVVRGEQLAPANEVAKYVLKDAKKTAAREAELDGLITLRQRYAELLEAEREGGETAEAARKALREAYDGFVTAHGPINRTWGSGYLTKIQDPFAASLRALERREGSKWVPAEILKRSTMRTPQTIEQPSIEEAYVLARNRSVNPSLAEIAERAGETEELVRETLLASGAIFVEPSGDIVPSDIYLSGNVREKMRQALAAQQDGLADMTRNIEALRRVMPADVPYFNIETQMGASWVPTPYYAQYIAHMLNLPDTRGINVRYLQGRWKVTLDSTLNNRKEASTGFGTQHYRFNKLVNAAISNQTVTIKRKDNEGKEYVDYEATGEANARIAEMREKFGEWLWSDADRRLDLETEYNEVRNNYADPHFDGSFMRMDGMALKIGESPFNLRKHQLDAIWRGVVNRRGIYAHEVGTGKSFTIAGIAVESRRYGIAKKPLVLAHNANSASLARDINVMYPGARVLYIDNLSPKEIDVRMRQIANDDWDAIVMPHSLIERLAFREETLMGIARAEIEAMEQEAIEAARENGVTLTGEMMDDPDAMKKVRSPTAKNMVKQRNRIIEGIKKQAQRSSREGAVSFEDLGIDMVLVDEAHAFKKPPITTRMNVKGLQTDTSQRSIQLMYMTNYLQGQNAGGGVHTFTGTPITNTLTEIFHQMRYVMRDEMEAVGLDQWDGWFGSFAKEVSDVEIDGAGEWVAVNRLRAFINVPELRRMVGQYMDVVFSDDMPEMQPRPTASGKTLNDPSLTERERLELLNGRTEGAQDRPYKKVVTDTVDMTPAQMRIFEHVQELANRWKQLGGKERREAMQGGAPYTPMAYEAIAARASFDARMVRDEELAGMEGQVPDDPNSKLSRAIANIVEIYNSDPNANQVVFSNTGLGKSASRRVRDAAGWVVRNEAGEPVSRTVKVFSPMHDMIERLVQQGIPREQIALVDGSTKKERRAEIAEAMNRSEIRVVIGSSESLGVGVNMQRNLHSMHHLDAPYMPGDLEQRNGRGHRQGNQWNTVREFRYITDRLDGRRWQILSIKDQFIKAFLQSDGSQRTIEGEAASEEESDILSTFSEAAGDPRILIRQRLDNQREQLLKRQSMHERGVRDARREVGIMTDRLAEMRATLAEAERVGVADKAEAAVAANAGKAFTMEVDGTTYTDRKEASEALHQFATMNVAKGEAPIRIGTYADLPISIAWGRYAQRPNLVIDLGVPQTLETGNESVASLEATLRGVRDQVDRLRDAKIPELERSLERMREVASTPFNRADKLEAVQRQFRELEADIAANPVPPPAWLRNGAAVDTEVMWQGQRHTVTGHRWTKDGWFVLADTPANESRVIPYLEVADEQGMPIYDERPFEAPELGGGIPLDVASRYQVGKQVLAANPETGADEMVHITRAAFREGGDDGGIFFMAQAPDGKIHRYPVSRPDPGGSVASSVRLGTAVSRDPATVEYRLRNGPLGAAMSAMLDSDKLRIIDRVPADLPRTAQAWVGDDGVINIAARNVDPANLDGVVLHEAFHSATRPLIGTRRWNELQDRLAKLYRQAERSTGYNRQFWDAARARIEAAEAAGDVMSDARRIEEFGAYALEEYSAAPASLKKWANDMAGRVKAWLQRNFGIQAGQVTPAQLRALAAAALRNGEIGASPALGPQGAPDTPEFRRWFGDSKVVDAQGRPKVMYHGTFGDFAEFQPSDQTGGLIFFTDQIGVAEAYARSERSGYGEMMRVGDLSEISTAAEAHPELFDGLRLRADAPATEVSRMLRFEQFPYEIERLVDRIDEGNITLPEVIAGFNETVDALLSGGSLMPVYLKAERPYGYRTMPLDWRQAEAMGADRLRAEGYDSVWVTEGNGAAIAVLDSTQIKSAIGNRGTYDPTNADITLSLRDQLDGALVDAEGNPVPEAERRAEVGKAVRNARKALSVVREDGVNDRDGGVVRDILKTTAWTFQPYTIASMEPAFTPVFRTAVDQQRFRDTIIADMYPKFRAYKELRAEGRARVNQVLELGRLAGLSYSDARLRQGITNTGYKTVVGMDAEGRTIRRREALPTALSKRGDVIKLTEAERTAYTELRGMFDQALELFRDQTLIDLGMGEFAGTRDPVAAILAAITPDMPTNVKERYETVAKMAEEIEQAKRSGYVPLSRHGRFVITVKEKQANIRYSANPAGGFIARNVPATMEGFMVEIGATWNDLEGGWQVSQAQRKQLNRENNRTVYSEKLDPESYANRYETWRASKTGKRAGEIAFLKEARARIAAEWGGEGRTISILDTKKARVEGTLKLSDIDTLADLAMIDNDTWNNIRDEFVMAMKGRGFRRHFFRADNVPGYDTDFERSIAEYMSGMAGYLSRRHHEKRWEDAIGKVKGPNLSAYSKEYRQYVNDPAEELAVLRQTGFLFYIAGNTSTALLNATQVPLMTMPALSQVMSSGKAAKHVAGAYKDALAMTSLYDQWREGRARGGVRGGLDMMLQMFDPNDAPADVRAEVKAAWDDGMFSPQFTHEVMGFSNRKDGSAAARLEKGIDYVATSYTYVERLNRLVTFIAAVRAAKDPAVQAAANRNLARNHLARATLLGEHWSPEAFGRFIVDESQFMMGKTNRAKMLRGAGAAIFQFMSFVINSLQAWYRWSTINGGSGKLATAYSIGAIVALSGVWGAPGLEYLRQGFEELWRLITGEDEDLRYNLREWVGRTTGHEWLGEIADKGLLHPAGADMSGRIGFMRMLPDLQSPVTALGIPADLLIGRPTRAIQQTVRGNYGGAVAELSPQFLRNPITAQQWKKQGVRTRAGAQVLTPEQIPPHAYWYKWMGIQPGAVSDVYQARFTASRVRNRVADRSSRMVNQIASAEAAAARNTDPSRQAALEARIDALWQAVDRYNDANPDSPLNVNNDRVRNKANEYLYGMEDAVLDNRDEALERVYEVYGVEGLLERGLDN